MKKILLFSFLFLVIHKLSTAQSKANAHHFEIKNGEFIYDGKPMNIHSGEMHYARIPKPYWRNRLQMLKAMGMNTVATYVFWNYQETSPGVWDFTTGNRNIRDFIKTAQEEGLFVILRLGPYSCGEWEFGGYPWWLQQNKFLEIRTYNQPFLDSCKVYLNKLAEEVRGLYVAEGGPIILVQIENEFGSYVAQRKDIPLAQHEKYKNAIRDLVKEAGFEEPYFTADGDWLFDGGSLPGILPAANGEGDIEKLKAAVNKYHDGMGPYMVGEFYPGWLDHWGEPFQKVATEGIVKQTEEYLQHDISFNFYMAHGGTNFGFTSGANYDKNHQIQPDITSYDYDAPISEAGWATPKYNAIRETMKKYLSYPIPAIPKPIPVIAIPSIALNKAVNVLDWENTLKPVINDSPLSFEDLNQGFGYVLYSKKFGQPTKGKLKIKGLRDFATIYVNGKQVGELNRQNNLYAMDIDIPAKGILDILVENMGRINYGEEIVQNRKGIISPVLIDDQEITGNWKMYKMPFNKVPDLSHAKYKTGKGLPTVYSGNFNLANTGDSFLDMEQWGKGIVFINGYTLGRYWKIGPQQTLYVPGCWLKKGKNEIVVFEQLNENLHKEIKTIATPILDNLKE